MDKDDAVDRDFNRDVEAARGEEASAPSSEAAGENDPSGFIALPLRVAIGLLAAGCFTADTLATRARLVGATGVLLRARRSVSAGLGGHTMVFMVVPMMLGLGRGEGERTGKCERECDSKRCDSHGSFLQRKRQLVCLSAVPLRHS